MRSAPSGIGSRWGAGTEPAGHGRRWRGRKGRSSGPCAAHCPPPARPPAALGLLPGWAGLGVGARSPRPPELPWSRPEGPGTRALPVVEEIMEGVSRLCSASLFTIWRPAFKLYFYSQRHFGCIYDLQTSPGEQWGNLGVLSAEARRAPGLGSCRWDPLSLPPLAPVACRSCLPLPSPPRAAAS